MTEPQKGTLGDAWDGVAHAWAAWARRPDWDSYWRFHRQAFFSLIPPPGRLTIDVGCGEGRVARDLKALGHDVMAFDISPTMVQYAREADPSMSVLVADAAHLPLEDEAADLVVAFMSLHDADDMPGAIGEIGRVLEAGGAACIAVVHPINSAGMFESDAPEARFIIERSYFEPRIYSNSFDRDGMRMTFTSRHWPLEAYGHAIERAGLVIEVLDEVLVDDKSVTERPSRGRWGRLPLFLDLRARKR